MKNFELFKPFLLTDLLTKKKYIFSLQNRTVAGLRVKWMCDKSNIRDYVQYLETSQSRSGRPPEEIPKPKFMSLIAEMIGAYCPALGPIPGKFTGISYLMYPFRIF